MVFDPSGEIGHTEEHHQQGGLGHQPVQHALVDLLDFIGQLPVVVIDEPLQDGLFILEVALEEQRIAIAAGWNSLRKALISSVILTGNKPELGRS